MKYHDQYEAFRKLAIQQGICRVEQLREALPFGYNVPEAKINKWLNNLLTVPGKFSTQRRYVNRFKLGADPEFIFTMGGSPVQARQLPGMHQGLAYGMDNNGRLIEIRPYPSRSALHVVASILATLRWLALLQPKALGFAWEAGVFLHGDGLGGHVHFGRKRPSRQVEIQALDTLGDELVTLRAYNIADILRRRQGDAHAQHYGMPGDFRLQRHGYEYRTFPSWLDSPELAFLILVLSKLAVHSPGLLQGYSKLQSYDRQYQRIKNLLSYYKNVDDDARLALALISRKFPVHIGGDFKARWGIAAQDGLVIQKVNFLPTSIKPTELEVGDLFQYLANGQKLGNTIPVPTWAPLESPSGYTMALNRVNTCGAKGLGEMLWDIVTSDNNPLTFVSYRGSKEFFSISNKLSKMFPVGWEKTCGNRIKIHQDGYEVVYSNEKVREGASFYECRRMLLETVFPLWRIGDVKPDSYLQWKNNIRPARTTQFTGHLLYGDINGLPKEAR